MFTNLVQVQVPFLQNVYPQLNMKDPFAKDLAVDSPTRESLKNVDGCYNKKIFKSSSFANSRRAIQSGADKISRTFRSVRNTFGNLSQVRNSNKTITY